MKDIAREGLNYLLKEYSVTLSQWYYFGDICMTSGKVSSLWQLLVPIGTCSGTVCRA
jgi:hypothetical protein